MSEKIKVKKKEISFLVIIILVISQIMSKEFNLVMLLLILFYLCVVKKEKILLNFPGYKIYFSFLFMGTIIGLMNVVFNDNNIYNLVKHIYYILLPFLYWEIGSILAENYNIDKKIIFNSIIVATVIYVIYDWYNIFNVLRTQGGNLSAYQFRNKISVGSYLPIIGLYIIYFQKDEIKLSNFKKIVLIAIFLATIVVHFSRTHLGILAILILFSGLKVNFIKIAKLFVIACVLFIIIAILLPSVYTSFMQKMMNSLNEINYSNDSWTYRNVTKNWRGYEMYCELQNFYSSNIFEEIFGGGFGSTLNVFGYAYLVSNEDSLLFLHNGYYTQLMIGGLLGVVLYLMWIGALYINAEKQTESFERNFLRGIAVVILFTSYFVNGPFYSASQAMFLFYFGIFMSVTRKGKNYKC